MAQFRAEEKSADRLRTAVQTLREALSSTTSRRKDSAYAAPIFLLDGGYPAIHFMDLH